MVQRELTRYEQFIIDNNCNFEVVDFYIHFGFKKELYAKQKLESAVRSVHATMQDSNKKRLLEEEFIIDNFEILNTTLTDQYWRNIGKLNSENETHKRVNETFITVVNKKTKVSIVGQLKNIAERLYKKKTKTDTEKKQITLFKNYIIDFTNTGASSQKEHLKQWDEWKIQFGQKPLEPHFLKQELKNFIKINFNKNSSSLSKALQCANQKLGNCSPELYYLYKILAHLLDSYKLHPELFNLEQAQSLSELDYILKLWGSLLEFLFGSSTDIKLRWGDTVLTEDSSKFKIDLRVCLFMNGFYEDLAVCEFSKLLTNQKVEDDHHKLVLESKAVTNDLLNKNLYLDPREFGVIAMQVCGIKGDAYVVDRFFEDRIRIPFSYTDTDAIILFLEKMIAYENYITELKNLIIQKKSEKIDRRRTFELKLRDSNNNDKKEDTITKKKLISKMWRYHTDNSGNED